MARLLCPLLLLLARFCAARQPETLPTRVASEIETLARRGDAVQLWQLATDSAAAAVVDALRKQYPSRSVELRGVDLDALRIWHGQTVSLGLQADGQAFRYVVSSEQDWRSLAQVLPASQGGLLPATDWERVRSDWLSPVSHGSLLPDFALEGPLDLSLSQPTALQLFLPHASDAGTVRRVLLREGAAVLVRGARAVRLRRGLDLPPISLSEFAGIVTSDAGQQQPLGVMHLLAGVRGAAAAHWNASHPGQSLGLVALQLDLAPSGAALLAAAAAPGGGSGRLRARRVKEGVIELLPREGLQREGGGGDAAADGGAVAVPGAAGQRPPGAWPLVGVHPSQLQAYERLLRQLISSRLFRAPSDPRQQWRVAPDVQLRLLETEAQATTLLQVRLELERRPAQGGTRAGASQQQQQQQQQLGQAAGPDGGDGTPRDVFEVAADAPGRMGPVEEWSATVAVHGDAHRGTLRFEPLVLQRVGASHDTVQLGSGALSTLFGFGNGTDVALALAEEQLLA